MITQQEIDEQVTAVEIAERKLDQAEEHHAGAGSETAVNELRVARAEAYAARDKLRHLRTRYGAEQAASVAREAAERAFPEKARKTLAKQLAEGRDEAARAVVEAQQAVARMLAAVAGYDERVRSAAGELRACGLVAGDGEELGGTAGGVAFVGGEVWRPASAADMLAAVVSAAVAERDPRHPLAAVRWRHSGGLAAEAGRDALLRAGVR
ncbi:hypothetical protein [Streptomyces sp. NBC_01373]|uniref:hypothetical protein n=1 Tax=Streptomyces sp. NBC_01373 TaxID=2903843 RepID=UPI00225BE2D3|nr:hypothetical protein [Streptomyces sp. NBC_01373]MCX4699531.1 hypothetical protein [Streptomyces sp. NBC_01373]